MSFLRSRIHVSVATLGVLALVAVCCGGKVSTACVDLEPSMFDTSCRADSDCVVASLGNQCDSNCLCGGSAINVADQARYQQLVSSVPSGLVCECPFLGAPTCVAGQCTVCGGPGPTKPGCPGVDAGPPSSSGDEGGIDDGGACPVIDAPGCPDGG